MSDYSLSLNDYTASNILGWGLFKKHCQKAYLSKGWTKVVHGLIALAEILPVVSQIASFIEFKIATWNKPRVEQPKELNGRISHKSTNETALTQVTPLSVMSAAPAQASPAQVTKATDKTYLKEKNELKKAMLAGDKNSHKILKDIPIGDQRGIFESVNNTVDQIKELQVAIQDKANENELKIILSKLTVDDLKGCSMMQYAANSENLVAVKLLFEKGVREDLTLLESGKTYSINPLYLSAFMGNIKHVQYWIKKGMKPDDHKDAITFIKDEACLKLLLKSSQDPKALMNHKVNLNGITPSANLVDLSYNNIELFYYLIGEGGVYSEFISTKLLNDTLLFSDTLITERSKAALQMACRPQLYKINPNKALNCVMKKLLNRDGPMKQWLGLVIKQLIKAGADINQSVGIFEQESSAIKLISDTLNGLSARARERQGALFLQELRREMILLNLANDLKKIVKLDTNIAKLGGNKEAFSKSFNKKAFSKLLKHIDLSQFDVTAVLDNGNTIIHLAFELLFECKTENLDDYEKILKKLTKKGFIAHANGNGQTQIDILKQGMDLIPMGILKGKTKEEIAIFKEKLKKIVAKLEKKLIIPKKN